MEELLQQELTTTNLCINKIISAGQGYEFLNMLFINKTRIQNKLREAEEKKWKRIFGEGV